jgi:hypothetical protein
MDLGHVFHGYLVRSEVEAAGDAVAAVVTLELLTDGLVPGSAVDTDSTVGRAGCFAIAPVEQKVPVLLQEIEIGLLKSVWGRNGAALCKIRT